MRNFFKSFGWATNGLMAAWVEERNFRIEIFIAFVVLAAAGILKFSTLEFLFLIIAIFMVLCAELINTAIEDVCNKIEPREDPHIGKIKDLMAAFVLTAAIGALIIGIVVFINHFV